MSPSEYQQLVAFLGETLHRHRPAVRLDGPALRVDRSAVAGLRAEMLGTSTSSTGGSSTSSRSITLSPAPLRRIEALLVDEGARRRARRARSCETQRRTSPSSGPGSTRSSAASARPDEGFLAGHPRVTSAGRCESCSVMDFSDSGHTPSKIEVLSCPSQRSRRTSRMASPPTPIVSSTRSWGGSWRCQRSQFSWLMTTRGRPGFIT